MPKRFLDKFVHPRVIIHQRQPDAWLSLTKLDFHPSHRQDRQGWARRFRRSSRSGPPVFVHISDLVEHDCPFTESNTEASDFSFKKSSKSSE